MNKIDKTSKIRRICVYCGSGSGTDPAFVQAARDFGRILAENRIGLVYGAGGAGMMGALADAVLENGGEATGIIPEFLMRREHALLGASKPSGSYDLVVTPDLHKRKHLMFEQADAFVALPGGIGTLEEVVEQMTWVQLGRHRKPIIIANIAGFWDPLCELLEHMAKFGFIHSKRLLNYFVVAKVDDVLPTIVEFLASGEAEGREQGQGEVIEKL